MAAPYNPPVRGEDFILNIALEDIANPGHFKVDPTIAAGDFQISKDNGALANLTTLPTVSPAGSTQVQITLTVAEMTADNVFIQGIDQAGDEWADFVLSIPTTA